VTKPPLGAEIRWGAFLLTGYAIALWLAVRAPIWRFLPIGELLVSFALVGVLAMSLTSALAFATRLIPERTVTAACLASFVVILVYLILWWLAYGGWFSIHAPALRTLLSLQVRVGISLLGVGTLALRPVGPRVGHAFASRAFAAGKRRSGLRSALGLMLLGGTLVTFASRALAGAVVVPVNRRSTDAPNIVMVLLDEWSANHANLPGLSYERETTPELGRLAERGRVFTRAYTNSVATRGSLKAIFTGVPFIRSHSPLTDPIPPTESRRTLFSKAQDAGYTIGYLSSYDNVIPEVLGFDSRGWLVESAVRCGWPAAGVNLDWFCVGLGGLLNWSKLVFPTPSSSLASASRMVSRLQPAGPFLLFVHVLAPHTPYRLAHSDRRYSLASSATWDLYDDYLRSVDQMTARFVEQLLHKAPRTLVVIFGDHGFRGEDLIESGEAVHVPILALGDGVAPGIDSSTLGLSELWSRVLHPIVPRFPQAPAVQQLLDGAVVTEIGVGPRRVAAIWRGSMCLLHGTTEDASCLSWARGPRGDDGHPRSPTADESRGLLEIREALAAPSVWQTTH
jgi:hypothetical protein